MAQEQKQNQDQVDGDILDLAVSVLERRGIGLMAAHELRGHSRIISGSREFTCMVQIKGHDVTEFIKHVNLELHDVGMFASPVNSYNIVAHSLIFLKVTCCDKLTNDQYRGILGGVYKTINLLTDFSPEEANLMGKGKQ
ncbi:hypothetical protein D3C75_1036140 [compost metagenome]